MMLPGWDDFYWPLARLLGGMCAGLLIAAFLEASNWAKFLGRIARPFAGLAHLGPTAAAAFALAFASPQAANAMLSEQRAKGSLPTRELILANLFCAVPGWISHFPTVFLLAWPALGIAAVYYCGLTLAAALLRTLIIMALGRALLPLPARACQPAAAPGRPGLGAAAKRALRRFKKRVAKLVCFTAPVYLLMWLGIHAGFFGWLEAWLAAHLGWLAFIKPQAMGIIALQFVAELGATFGAASAALAGGSLSDSDVVLALLAGNVLATPLRAMRHQLPAYAGFYAPGLAVKLVAANQGLRAASIVAVILVYLAFAKVLA